MNLRAPSQRQQILFAIVFACSTLTVCRAQTPAPLPHALKLKGSATTQPGTILSVAGNGVQFQTPAGTLTYPLANVESVTMPAPAEIGQAQLAFEANDYQKALALAKGVADKYKGLPIEWAQLAVGLTANLYIATGDIPKAQATLTEFETLYKGAPGAGLQADVGRARIAVAKKDYLTARDKAGPITEQALKEKNVPAGNRIAFSGAFYVMGQVKESEKDLSGALEDYLRTITIFYHDSTAKNGAQERADALRKDNKNKKTTEQLFVP
jgi:tetratricopeptide (TPR) repeat protein